MSVAWPAREPAVTRNRVLSWAALVAQGLFVTTWLVAGLWQVPAYSAVEHTISDMYAEDAPHGWVLVVVLTVCGLVTLAFSLLVVPALLSASGRWAWATAALLALSILALGDSLSAFERQGCMLATPGCTPHDQAAGGGVVDSLLSTIGLLVLVPAGFVLAGAVRRTPGLEHLRRPAQVFSIVLLVVLVAFDSVDQAGYGGLLERFVALWVAAGMAGLALAAIRLTPVRDETPDRV